MMRRSSLFFFLFLIFSIALGQASGKKTFCSITINSDNEINAFKRNLSPEFWDFKELVPQDFSGDRSKFLQMSCRPDIRCDILVISGHFSGIFVGSTSFNLPIDTMETLSCEKNCDGIFKAPQEVFLFGCNTLASQDSLRSDTQALLSHLERRGFSRTQAAQVMEFRATQFGKEMKERMRSVFPQAQAIFGFPKIAPTGPQIEPHLNAFLNETKNRYNSKESNLSYNTQFRTAAERHLIPIEARWVQGESDTSITKKPYCSLLSQGLRSEQVIDSIENLFDQRLAWQSLKQIESSLAKLTTDPTISPNYLEQRLQKIRDKVVLQEEFKRILGLTGDPFILFKGSTIKTLEKLMVLSSKESEQEFLKLLNLSTPFSEVRKDLICALAVQINLNYDQIPSARWRELNFINTLGCIRPRDSRIYQKLMEIQRSLPQQSLARSSIFAILSGRHNFESGIKAELTYLLLKGQEGLANRQLISSALAFSQPLEPVFIAQLAKVLAQETHPPIRRILERAINGAPGRN